MIGRSSLVHPWRHSWLGFLGLLMLGWFPTLSLQAEAPVGDTLTTEQVLTRANRALGGDAAWASLETLEIQGEHTSFSTIKACTLRKKRPNRWRFDHHDTEYRALHVYDGETGWWQKDFVVQSQGANWPQNSALTFQRVFAAEAEFDPPMINWREKGHRFEYLGRRMEDLEPYIELKLWRGEIAGAEERWLLDPQTFLPAIRISEAAYLPVQAWEQRTFFYEYRTVAGVQIPHYIEMDIGNSMFSLRVTEVQVNAPIDDALFRMPLPAGMQALQSLAGEWQVQVESFLIVTQQWSPSAGRALIRPDFGGALLTEEIEFTSLDFPWRVRRQLTWDRFREVYSISSFDNFSHHLDLHEGRFEEGKLVTTNLEKNTPWITYGHAQHGRDVVSEIQSDSFRRVHEVSLDGGKTWIPTIRFLYLREKPAVKVAN